MKTHPSFEEFVSDFDPDRMIDHFRWKTCAVGSYYNYLVGLEVIEDDDKIFDSIELVAETLLDGDEELAHILNRRGENEDGDTIIETYGDLQDYFELKD